MSLIRLYPSNAPVYLFHHLYIRIFLLQQQYAPCVRPYSRSTHSSTSNCNIFVSISRLRAFKDLEFDFVIASAGFDSPLIHLTFAISLRLYAWQRHIISIMRRFSCVVPNLTKHSYNNLESVQRTRGKSILRTLSIVDFAKALISKLYAIA
jgi:hypothetical protein